MSTGKVIAIIGGIILIAAGIWAALPLFVNKQVNEALPTGSTSSNATTKPESSQVQDTTTQAAGDVKVLSAGEFSGFDDVHQAGGTAKLVEVSGKQYVRFEDDFTVTNGPDLYVYFGKDGKYASEARLGKLKGNIGAQNYEIPADIDANAYNEVWVWCRAFSVPFGKAALH